MEGEKPLICVYYVEQREGEQFEELKRFFLPSGDEDEAKRFVDGHKGAAWYLVSGSVTYYSNPAAVERHSQHDPNGL